MCKIILLEPPEIVLDDFYLFVKSGLCSVISMENPLQKPWPYLLSSEPILVHFALKPHLSPKPKSPDPVPRNRLSVFFLPFFFLSLGMSFGRALFVALRFFCYRISFLILWSTCRSCTFFFEKEESTKEETNWVGLWREGYTGLKPPLGGG